MRNPNEPRKTEGLGEPAAKRPSEGEVIPFEQRSAQAQTPGATETSPLLAKGEAEEFRSRWNAIQSTFVDEPQKAIEEADKLVTNAIQRISQVYGDERARLEGYWKRGEQASTEDLRVALQRYRAFFARLTST
jgi:hypothetical protein